MNILKKNGTVQPYNSDKVALTLARTSDDLRQPLSEGDMREVMRNVDKRVAAMDTDPLPSSCVQVAVIAALKELGFHAIAQAYYEHGYRNG